MAGRASTGAWRERSTEQFRSAQARDTQLARTASEAPTGSPPERLCRALMLRPQVINGSDPDPPPWPREEEAAGALLDALGERCAQGLCLGVSSDR